MWIRRPPYSHTLILAVCVAASVSLLPATASKPTYAHKMEMGQLLYFNGDIDRSIKAFEAASELNDKAFEPHLNLVNLYVQKGGDEGLANAARECGEVLKRKPSNKDIHLILGNLLRTQAGNETDPDKMKVKLTEAAQEVQTAQDMGANKAMCENTIGLIELQRGDNEKALEHINNAIEKQPVFADAHLVRAVLLFKQMMQGPKPPESASDKGGDKKGSDDKSSDTKNSDTKSDAKGTDKTAAGNSDAKAADASGDSAAAGGSAPLQGNVKVNVKNKPNKKDLESKTAASSSTETKVADASGPKDLNSPALKPIVDEVLHELDLSIKQKEKNAEAHNTKADILFAMGKHEDALKEYKKATEDEPKYAQAWAGIGTTHAQLLQKETDSDAKDKRLHEAKDAYAKARRLKPNDKNIGYGLALMLEKLGMQSEARAEFQTTMMMEEDPLMRAQIQLHLQQMGGGGLGGINTKLQNFDGTASSSGTGMIGNGLFTSGALSQPFKDLIKIKAPPGQLKEKKQDE
jgi:tetratricopeptide (TPR) repeat protein